MIIMGMLTIYQIQIQTRAGEYGWSTRTRQKWTTMDSEPRTMNNRCWMVGGGEPKHWRCMQAMRGSGSSRSDTNDDKQQMMDIEWWVGVSPSTVDGCRWWQAAAAEATGVTMAGAATAGAATTAAVRESATMGAAAAPATAVQQLGFRTGNPRVGFSRTVPAPWHTVPVAGTTRTRPVNFVVWLRCGRKPAVPLVPAVTYH